MKKNLFLITLLIGLCFYVYADYTIESLLNGLSDYGVNDFGQSFTTLNAGEIETITVDPSEDINTTLRIFVGESINFANEIYNQAVSFPNLGTHTIILTTPVSVNESTVYTFAFDNAGLFFSEPNNYSGGRLLYGSTFYSGFELYFQVAVNEDAPLPVTLSSFSAVFSNGSSLLYWTTQSENNNLGWNVYRSETDNIAEGFQINEDTIEGAGTTTAQTDYSFADQNEIFLGTSYWYWIENVDNGGTTVLHGPIQIDIPDSEDNELPPELINSYGLAQNYPNPFNPTTTIAFKLTSGNADNAVINIYNPKGQIVKTFENLTLNDTEFGSVTWDGKDNFGNEVSSGIYMYKLKTPNYEYSKKMIMVK